MPVDPDVASIPANEVAAQRRWLITIAITIVFGGFGAVMAYLSYANSNKPAPRRSSVTSPSTAPATPTVVAPTPSAVVPSTDKPDKGKPDKDK